eukprot:3938845-Rhodomonas_salina.2
MPRADASDRSEAPVARGPDRQLREVLAEPALLPRRAVLVVVLAGHQEPLEIYRRALLLGDLFFEPAHGVVWAEGDEEFDSPLPDVRGRHHAHLERVLWRRLRVLGRAVDEL